MRKERNLDGIDWEGQIRKKMNDIAGMKAPQENTDSIRRFDMRSQNGVKTRLFYLITLEQFLEQAPKKPFKEFVRDDFNKWVKHIDSIYKPATMNIKIKTVKLFFRFVLDLEEDEKPPCMRGIRLKKIDWREREIKLSKAILSKEEILKMINATTSRKYRAMCSVLFDGSLRKSELMGLTIGDLDIQPDYIDITVREGKGGTTDIITLIDSVPYLKAWLSEHPFYEGENTDPDIPLWTKERNPLYKEIKEGKEKRIVVYPLKSWVVGWLIPYLAGKVGIKRHVWPHLTRHSKISSMLAEGYSVAEAGQHARHRSLSSTLLYTHIAENGLKEKMLTKNGKRPETQKPENVMKSIACARCKEENSPTNKFCARCGWEFGKDLIQVKLESEKQRISKEFMNFVMDDPEASTYMENMMKMFVNKRQMGG